MNDLRDDEPVEVVFVAKALRQTRLNLPIDGWESRPVDQDDVDRAREIVKTIDGIRNYWHPPEITTAVEYNAGQPHAVMRQHVRLAAWPLDDVLAAELSTDRARLAAYVHDRLADALERAEQPRFPEES